MLLSLFLIWISFLGIVPNVGGRVLADASQDRLQYQTGVYVCGWLKRGPTGIIGTNLYCAEETVSKLILKKIKELDGWDFVYNHDNSLYKKEKSIFGSYLVLLLRFQFLLELGSCTSLCEYCSCTLICIEIFFSCLMAYLGVKLFFLSQNLSTIQFGFKKTFFI